MACPEVFQDHLTMNDWRTYLYLGLAAIFWGGTFVAGRQLGPLIEPHVAALLRFMLASVLLLAWQLWRHGRLPAVTARQLPALLLLGLFGVLSYNLLFFEGLKSVEAGRASLIVAANPVVIALASSLLFGERPGTLRSLGIGLSVVGAMVVIGRGDLTKLLSTGLGSGELMLLGCVASWVAYTLIGRHVLHGMSPLTAVVYSSLFGTVMLAAVTSLRGGIDSAAVFDIRLWSSIGYLSVFGTALAFVWYYKGVHSIGAARAAQFINLVPVSGVFFGAVLLHEPLTGSLLVGGSLVLGGLWLTNRPVAVAQRQDDPTGAADI